MFYITNLKGLQSPYKPEKLQKKSVTKTEPISSVKSGRVTNDLKEDRKTANPYEKQIKKETLKRKVPKLASDIMSSPVFTLKQSEKVAVAIKAFLDKRYRHIPIVDDSYFVVGIISDRDVININGEVEIKEIMTKDIIIARPDASLRSISTVLIEERIGCIPVISDQNEILGIITRTDILRSLVRDAPLDLVL